MTARSASLILPSASASLAMRSARSMLIILRQGFRDFLAVVNNTNALIAFRPTEGHAVIACEHPTPPA